MVAAVGTRPADARFYRPGDNLAIHHHRRLPKPFTAHCGSGCVAHAVVVDARRRSTLPRRINGSVRKLIVVNRRIASRCLRGTQGNVAERLCSFHNARCRALNAQRKALCVRFANFARLLRRAVDVQLRARRIVRLPNVPPARPHLCRSGCPRQCRC